MEISMKLLESAVLFAQEVHYQFFAIKIEMDDFPDSEVIINPIINMVEKLEYWKNTYNEDLTHKHSSSIKIVDFAMGDSYEDIQIDFAVSIEDIDLDELELEEDAVEDEEE